MNKGQSASWTELGDSAALKVQELRKNGRIDDSQALFRIDYRSEAANAPFLFDVANGKLHRAGCKFIPKDAKAALYGVWEPGAAAHTLACRKCKPDLQKNVMKKKNDTSSDVIYGLLSLFDQFGSVLGERGKEYRNSERGRALEKAVQTVSSNLDQRQKELLHSLSAAMDGLFEIIQGCNDSLNTKEQCEAPGGASGSGSGGSPSPGSGKEAERPRRRTKKRTKKV